MVNEGWWCVWRVKAGGVHQVSEATVSTPTVSTPTVSSPTVSTPTNSNNSHTHTDIGPATFTDANEQMPQIYKL